MRNSFALLLIWLAIASVASGQTLDNPLFVFNNGVKDSIYDTVDEQIQLLLDNDYPGMEKQGLDNFDEVYQALREDNLKLYTVYVNINLDDPAQPYHPQLEEVLKKIAGTGTMPWFFVTSKQYPPSSAEYDSVAVPILQQVADLAQQHDVRVMLYPHRYFWIEKVEDAIRVARKANRRNLGITFNLCHYLANRYNLDRDPWAELPALAKAASPYLFAISLNGADATPSDASDIWASFIQPLGEGSFDTYDFLKTFLDLGFDGPVGLQCYSIDQDKAVHLKKSHQTWEEYKQRYASEGKR
ncbi:sugar phosphate isomerase/epimerase family protein [Tunicatimonas pelagia]|uniref:sugar phosphate isomerase/epimerase family protein n=1 Tax=Tunicatimonas pelagia TaxID=931531 RepID=UPI002666B70C|nr:TIM barrel protein [Tunicatimonas pelagia]WKN42431.1 TIM barrel protein [Tunicatimonas pelagia]